MPRANKAGWFFGFQKQDCCCSPTVYAWGPRYLGNCLGTGRRQPPDAGPEPLVKIQGNWSHVSSGVAIDTGGSLFVRAIQDDSFRKVRVAEAYGQVRFLYAADLFGGTYVAIDATGRLWLARSVDWRTQADLACEPIDDGPWLKFIRGSCRVDGVPSDFWGLRADGSLWRSVNNPDTITTPAMMASLIQSMVRVGADQMATASGVASAVYDANSPQVSFPVVVRELSPFPQNNPPAESYFDIWDPDPPSEYQIGSTVPNPFNLSPPPWEGTRKVVSPIGVQAFGTTFLNDELTTSTARPRPTMRLTVVSQRVRDGFWHNLGGTWALYPSCTSDIGVGPLDSLRCSTSIWRQSEWSTDTFYNEWRQAMLVEFVPGDQSFVGETFSLSSGVVAPQFFTFSRTDGVNVFNTPAVRNQNGTAQITVTTQSLKPDPPAFQDFDVGRDGGVVALTNDGKVWTGCYGISAAGSQGSVRRINGIVSRGLPFGPAVTSDNGDAVEGVGVTAMEAAKGAVISSDGTLRFWGTGFSNLPGGPTDATFDAFPVVIEHPYALRWVSVAGLSRSLHMIDEEGTMWAWGRQDFSGFLGWLGSESGGTSSALDSPLGTFIPLKVFAPQRGDSVWKFVSVGGFPWQNVCAIRDDAATEAKHGAG